MTQEQMKKAAELCYTLDALKDTKDKMEEKGKYRLDITSCSMFGLRAEELVKPVRDILNKHYNLILDEIDAEIEAINKQIEQL